MKSSYSFGNLFSSASFPPSDCRVPDEEAKLKAPLSLSVIFRVSRKMSLLRFECKGMGFGIYYFSFNDQLH
jgi:hypothetical protein